MQASTAVRIDTVGLRCPQPVLRLALASADLPEGALVDIAGDCPTFEADIRSYCQRRNKTVIAVRHDGDVRVISVLL